MSVEQEYCCTEGACPFSFSEESEYVQNLGCLPTPHEIVQMRVKYGKTWACHADYSKPCLGAIRYLRAAGQEYKVIDDKLLNETSDWHNYCDEGGVDELNIEALFSHKRGGL